MHNLQSPTKDQGGNEFDEFRFHSRGDLWFAALALGM
jgi:hypothetical protein